MQHCVQVGCYELLASDNVFRLELNDYLKNLHSSNTQLHNNHQSSNMQYTSVQGILCLIDLVFDMFRDIGLLMHYNVYMSVRLKQDVKFEIAHGWNTCGFSKLPSLHCIRVDAQITLHNKYAKWLQCLWLITHMHEIEHQRAAARSCANVQYVVEAEDAELYRKSILFVLESLEVVYTHVMSANMCKIDLEQDTQKNKTLKVLDAMQL